MVLQIDPRYPLVWRSPSSLQLGVDSPPVVLDDVSDAQERMISALVAGITRPGLDMVATAAGADAAAVTALLDTVRPALRRAETAPQARTVTIAGRGPTVGRMADALTASGMVPRLVAGDLVAASEPAHLAVVVAHYVVDPEFHGLWLRRDLPHLPVVFGDTGARVGPIVEPGIGPCLYCLERHHTDADPAWPAMASQLWGRRSVADAGLVAGEVAAIVTRIVLARLADGQAGAATSVQLDAAGGTTTSTTWTRHPECGCAALPGSETAGAEQSAAERPRPRTGGVAAGRA